jgi:Holliday junction resolvase RusA-like endonuclease
MELRLTIPGEPQGKQRPRFARMGNKTITRTPDKTVIYENLIVTAYQSKYGDAKFKFADNEPLDMRIDAYFPVPASVSNKKREQMYGGIIRPAKKPDADNIIKVVADSLNGIAYRDDAQIVECRLAKYYSDHPRLEIIIFRA